MRDDVFTILRRDHEEVEKILDAVAGPADGQAGPADPPRAERRRLVEQLVIAESEHEAAEEQHFWPTVRSLLPDGPALVERALDQEQHGKQLLQQLMETDEGHAGFKYTLQTFVAAAREHIAFEQEQVWPAVRAAMSGDEAVALGQKVARAKRSGPTRPHPRTPPNPMVLKSAGLGAAVLDRLRDALGSRGSKG